MATLKKDLKIGESLTIGDTIVTLVAKSGQMARLSIVADKSVRVDVLPAQEYPVSMAAGGVARRPG